MKRKIRKRKWKEEVLLTPMKQPVMTRKSTTKCNWRRNIASLSTN